ncbi:hypothetical protein [Lysinibacillus sp. G4S2]|uniref:hypothetical protein n=1 Tax=Lysinibacillus sp. G4S2 TaxID=3055859 RepID=UPI0025A0BC34|nr:hypothetical protein [Lysinibacillus sp. G4S2]MDM5246929.1 hypothetical protein [Lysinibacillus sp. G4S2]
MHYLRESVAAATIALSARKRSGSYNCIICAKAKRQLQQMVSVAKAKRQLQLHYLRESEASAPKRPAGTEINHTLCKRAILYSLNFIDTIVFQQYKSIWNKIAPDAS